MYQQGVLTPRFDVYDFVAAYTERQIDIEEESYDIISEGRTYFEQLKLFYTRR